MGAFVNHQYGIIHAGGRQACPRGPRELARAAARRDHPRAGSRGGQAGGGASAGPPALALSIAGIARRGGRRYLEQVAARGRCDHQSARRGGRRCLEQVAARPNLLGKGARWPSRRWRACGRVTQYRQC